VCYYVASCRSAGAQENRKTDRVNSENHQFNGHKIEKSVNSPCFHPVFGPPFTPLTPLSVRIYEVMKFIISLV